MEEKLAGRGNRVSGAMLITVMFLIVITMSGTLIRQLYRSNERIGSLAILSNAAPASASGEQQAIETGLAQRFWRVPAFRLLRPGAVRTADEAKRERVRAALRTDVTMQGDSLALTAKLTELQTGKEIWTRQYQGARRDLGALAGTLFTDLCDRLQLELSSGIRDQLAKPPTDNAAAYVEWAKARPQRDVAGLERALSLDPQFSLAQGDLAEAYLDRDQPEPARRNAEAALRRDPQCAPARAALARLAARQWDWGQSRAEFQAALDAVPGDPSLHLEYAVSYLLPTMQIIEARAELEKALAADPTRAEIHAGLARAFYASYDFLNAEQAAREALRLDPGSLEAHFVLAGCAHKAGRRDEEQQQSSPVAAAQGSPYERMLQVRLRADSGDKTGLQTLLNKGLSDHAAWLPVAVTSPEMDPYRSDPGIASIRRAAGFR